MGRYMRQGPTPKASKVRALGGVLYQARYGALFRICAWDDDRDKAQRKRNQLHVIYIDR
jgi:hypothetical protein